MTNTLERFMEEQAEDQPDGEGGANSLLVDDALSSPTIIDPDDGKDIGWYHSEIKAAWGKTLAGILGVARLLHQAKEALGDSAYNKLVDRCPFDRDAAKRFRRIARDTRINDPNNWKFLPPSWSTLVEIASLTDEQFQMAIETKLLKPTVIRKAIKIFKSTWGRPIRQDQSDKARETINARYYVVYINPKSAPTNEIQEVHRVMESIKIRNPEGIRVEETNILARMEERARLAEKRANHQAAWKKLRRVIREKKKTLKWRFEGSYPDLEDYTETNNPNGALVDLFDEIPVPPTWQESDRRLAPPDEEEIEGDYQRRLDVGGFLKG